MVVDDDCHLRKLLLAERRLDVDHREGVEALKLVRGDPVDLDLQRLHHGHVLRARDGPEREEGRGGSGATDQGAEREAAGEGVRVGVVLEEDPDSFLAHQHVPETLHPHTERRPVHVGSEAVAQGAPERHTGDRRVAGGYGRAGRSGLD